MDSDSLSLCPNDTTRIIGDMKWLLVGIVASTVVYSFNTFIAVLCLCTLVKGRKEGSSKKRLASMCLYIISMLGLGTAAVVYSNLAVAKLAKIIVESWPALQADGKCFTGLFSNILNGYDYPYLYNFVVPPSLPITIWAADGILIWRCSVLYQAVSPPNQIFLYVPLAMLGAVSLASGGYSYWNPPDWVTDNDIALKAAAQLIFPSTIAANTLVSGLIAARLMYAQRLFMTSVPNYDGTHEVESPYISALAICVESSAVIVLWAAVSLMTTSIAYADSQTVSNYSGGYLIPVIIFPQICVMAPLLIVYRVARRRTNDIMTTLEDSLARRSIAFHHSQPNDTFVEVSA